MPPEWVLGQKWKVQENDLIGGWCITFECTNKTPAEGATFIADFVSKEVAEHIVKLQNAQFASP